MDSLDTSAIRAAGGADAATVAALCDALDAARGESARAAKRLEIAQAARAAAEVERSRFYAQLSATQAECHAVLGDKETSDAERALARRILAASRRKG